MNQSFSGFSAGASVLEERGTSLVEEILALPPGIISLTGAGGKTSLLFGLGAGLARLGNNGRGARVLLTTTTRVQRPHKEQCALTFECGSIDEIILPETPVVALAAKPAGPGRNPEYLQGFSGEEINDLHERGAADWILVEADGAARRPLKAPVEKEPVIPSGSVMVIAVAGLSGIGQPFTDSTVFRSEAFASVTGLVSGQLITAEAASATFIHPQGLFKNSPDKARRMAFLNQADLEGRMESARRLAGEALLHNLHPLFRIFAGSASLPCTPCTEFLLTPSGCAPPANSPPRP